MSNINHHKHIAIEKAYKPLFGNWFVWVGMIGITLIIIFSIFWGYKFFFQLPMEKQAELETEFKAIVPLQGASVVDYHASNKAGQALVSVGYLTDINSADIFKYYDEQLRQHGWQPDGTHGVKDWGRDLGGKSADYCKGDYAAELQYAGQQANYGWTYGLSMSWGLDHCKTGS